MRVTLSGGIFSSTTVRPSDLASLIAAAVKGRHTIEIENEEAWTTWLNARDAQMQANLSEDRQVSERSARDELSGNFTVRVEDIQEGHWEPPTLVLNVTDSERLLAEPLGLLVENVPHDIHFLLRLVPVSLRSLLEEGIEDGWITRLHGGGGTIHDQMKLRARPPRVRLRTFVMFDSDRLHPDELADGWRNKLPAPDHEKDAQCAAWDWEQTARREFSLQYHRLNRRFIESYMPAKELETWCGRERDEENRRVPDKTSRQRAYGTFQGLADDQRWFFHMKSGLQGDSAPTTTARQRGLFNNLGDAERNNLQNGFGRTLSTWYDPAINSSDFVWDPAARAEGETISTTLFRMM